MATGIGFYYTIHYFLWSVDLFGMEYEMNERIQDIPTPELLSEIQRLTTIAEHNTIANIILDLYKQEAVRRMVKPIQSEGYCACCGAKNGTPCDESCVWS